MAIACGTCVGFVNGFIIAKFHINALITTLATMQIVRGLALIASDRRAVGIGFHPFFPLTPQTTLLAPATAWWTERDAHPPGSRGALVSDVGFSTARRLPGRRLNNCFEGWNGSARIVWPERHLGVDIAADSMLDRYMLFAPNGKRDFFCLEPMSHSPNALKHFETEPMGLALRTDRPGQCTDQQCRGQCILHAARCERRAMGT